MYISSQQLPAGHSKVDDQEVDVFPLFDAEEQATWYYGTEVADVSQPYSVQMDFCFNLYHYYQYVKVKPYYIPLVTQNEDLDDYRPGIRSNYYFIL